MGPRPGQQLSRLLAQGYPDEAEVRALVEGAGISTGFLRSGSTSMFVYWFELAKELNENRLLGNSSTPRSRHSGS